MVGSGVELGAERRSSDADVALSNSSKRRTPRKSAVESWVDSVANSVRGYAPI